MADPSSPVGGQSSPDGRVAASDPRGEIARREMQQLIASTLSEIQHEQGRHAERFDTFNDKLDRLINKIDDLTISSALQKATLDRIEPDVRNHDGTLKTIRGISIGVAALLAASAAVIYFTNKSRLDRVLLILDSPTIQKILKKEGG